MIAGNSRLATERPGATILAWNTAAMGRDDVRAGGMTRVAVGNDGATKNKAPREEDEASMRVNRCDGMEWC